MDAKRQNLISIKVIINCRNKKTVRPELLESLKKQDQDYELFFLESTTSPNRLNQVQDQDAIYFCFDEDVEIPSPQYLSKLVHLFQEHSNLLFVGGKYLSIPEQSYLAKSYNSLTNNWMQISDESELLTPVENLPGGAWIISGKIKKYLEQWKELKIWAGEDTYTLRWLELKGVSIFYSPLADLLHFPRIDFFYFCKRAFLQGQARRNLNIKNRSRKIKFKSWMQNFSHTPGWLLHQLLVELGALMRSRKAKATPQISPAAYKK